MSPLPITRFSGQYAFLSNFYRVRIPYEGIAYPSVEHAYQAAKTENEAERLRISRLGTPGLAKREGRKVTLRENWEALKVKVMGDLLRIKFQEPTLRRLLLETGERELVEGNTWGDIIWGRYEGRGQNLLGRLLMEIRAEIRAEEKLCK